jgi:galactokinase
LVESDAVDAFKQNIASEYFSKTGLKPEILVSSATDGAGQVDVSAKDPDTDRD